MSGTITIRRNPKSRDAHRMRKVLSNARACKGRRGHCGVVHAGDSQTHEHGTRGFPQCGPGGRIPKKEYQRQRQQRARYRH